jgi:two-component system, OmpR family, copper resistance phosphate regulon response regulator CusR
MITISTASGTLQPRSARTRILVVEDEPKVAHALLEGLEGEGYEAVIAPTGERAFFRASTEAFDLHLLDLTLPDRDGLEILTALREGGSHTPVLVLTARGTVGDHVIGLDSGADDYLTKPFAFEELLARIRALLRRGRTVSRLSYQVADLEMDLVTRHVTRGGRAVELTALEFELLEYLLRYERQPVSRAALGRSIWNERGASTTLDNVMDVHIARLRKKIDADHPVRLIHTVRGVGFVLREGEP